MSEFMVKNFELQTNEDDLDKLARNLSKIQVRVNLIKNTLAFQIASSNSIRSRLNSVSEDIYEERQGVQRLSKGLQQIRLEYGNTENRICGQVQAKWAPSKLETFVVEFKENYSCRDFLKGAGYVGTIYNLQDDIKNADGLKDYIKSGKDIAKFIDDAADTYRRYQKIGNAVGGKKSTVWWFKNITGLKSIGRVSKAKNPITRFKNNLTNKTSPFRNQITDAIDGFKGKKGVGKAVASWAQVFTDGVLNWFDNKEEQANSNGTMSNERVVAETVSETIIDTALTYGANAVVGAAVATVLGTTAAPAILVITISGVLTTEINAGVKALTGKTTTEWISDSILDCAEKAGNAVRKEEIYNKNLKEQWDWKYSFV